MADRFGDLRKTCASSICRKCKERRCEFKRGMAKGRRGFIIDCDKYSVSNGIQGKIADCVFIEDSGQALRIAVAELKSGGLDPRSSIKQIQATLQEADRLLSGHQVETALPVLVIGKRLHPDDYRILGRTKVSFRGLQRMVLTARCGSSLAELANRYGATYRLA